MDFRQAVAVAGAALALGIAGQAQAGQLHGVVRLDGPRPEPAVITITATSTEYSIEGCGAVTKPSQQLLVDRAGGIQNVVVWVDLPGAPREAAVDMTATLDQHACVFEPHLVVLPIGGTLVIRNSDPVLHNVRIFQARTMLMHEWQKPQDQDLTWRFTEPGRYLVRCGVHAWMYAWVVIGDPARTGVTDAAGQFTLSGIPEGRYTLHVWHETLGEREQPVTVTGEGSTVTIHVPEPGTPPAGGEPGTGKGGAT